jgi:integrase
MPSCRALFVTAVRWEWITRNPAASAKLPKNRSQPAVALSPGQVAKVIAVAKDVHPELATYLWLVAVTGARRGELCGLWWADLDLEVGSVHVAHNYLVRGGQGIRKDTKTHQDRRLAIDRVTCDVLARAQAAGGGGAGCCRPWPGRSRLCVL